MDTKVAGESRYKNTTPFPDPFTILSLLADRTKHAQLFTAVLIAPQMSTAELAQRIATTTNLSKGRFNLGLGVGWSLEEYKALGRGDCFRFRGKILNQQIDVVRQLLLGESVTTTIDGTRENFCSMQINPHAAYDVPIWIGGQSQAARIRAAKYGTGWMPLGNLDKYLEQKAFLNEQLVKFNKNPDTFQTMGRIALGKTPPEQWVDEYLGWIAAGVTHLALTTTGEDNNTKKNALVYEADHHIQLLQRFHKATEFITSAKPSNFSPHHFAQLDAIWANNGNESIFGCTTRCFELRELIKPEHLQNYLLDRGYALSALEDGISFTHHGGLSKNVLYCYQKMTHPFGNTVWFMREQEQLSNTTYIVYS